MRYLIEPKIKSDTMVRKTSRAITHAEKAWKAPITKITTAASKQPPINLADEMGTILVLFSTTILQSYTFHPVAFYSAYRMCLFVVAVPVAYTSIILAMMIVPIKRSTPNPINSVQLLLVTIPCIPWSIIMKLAPNKTPTNISFNILLPFMFIPF